jgi:hypothetical protein
MHCAAKPSQACGEWNSYFAPHGKHARWMYIYKWSSAPSSLEVINLDE